MTYAPGDAVYINHGLFHGRMQETYPTVPAEVVDADEEHVEARVAGGRTFWIDLQRSELLKLVSLRITNT